MAPPDGRSWGRLLWLLGALLVATLVAYHPAWHGGMLWDDDGHVTPQPLRSGAGLYRIWFEFGASQQYYPVLHSAFWVLYRLWGDDTLGYHLVTICLHTFCAWLLAVLLRRMRVPGATLAALVFALHPVHVESVAWISEMKNTLAGVLYLTAALVYLRFDATRRWRFYALAAVAFTLALLSKSVTATLPIAVLIVIWWQRGRIRLREDVAPLLPFIAVGAGAGLLTAWVERTYIGAAGTEFGLSLVERGLVAGRAAWFYLAKVFWPVGLVFIYPKWTIDSHAVVQYLFPLSFGALVLAAWWARRWTRAPLAAVLFFLVTLAPALGFVSVFPFRYSFVADHFQYLASIGPIVLACAALAEAARRWAGTRRVAVMALALPIPLGLGVMTRAQSFNYVDSDTLYRATIRDNPGCWLAHQNLGFDLLKRGQTSDARREFEEAVRLEPTAIEAQQNLGSLLLDAGQPAEALSHFEMAFRVRGDYPNASFGMGRALATMGRPAEAIEHFNRTLALDPGYPEVRVHLGAALEAEGQADAALEQYAAAVSREPDSVFAHSRYADLLRRAGRKVEAVAEYREALKRDPSFAGVCNALGVTLAELGRFDEAADQFRAAIRLRPTDLSLRENLARALAAGGHEQEAEAVLKGTRQFQPGPAGGDLRKR